ncbi:MAG: hypothetical protein ACYDDS_18985 [Candidatus Sulfotelmatobacter sp.]
MSRKRLSYNKHVVEATSLSLRDGGFTVHFFIEDHTSKAHVDVTEFQSGQRFATDEEALTAGIELGKRKVDEGYEVGTLVVNNARPARVGGVR